MTICDFMSDSPILTIFLAMMILPFAFVILFTFVFKLPNRILRSQNIRKHGWPPPHCDADGDFKPNEEKEDKR